MIYLPLNTIDLFSIYHRWGHRINLDMDARDRKKFLVLIQGEIAEIGVKVMPINTNAWLSLHRHRHKQ